jgi:NAD-dependent deacetylase
MDKVNQAITLSQHSDLFIVVGSTLLVQPAAHMPIYAKQNNAVLAIINLSETPCDDMCDILITEKAGVVLDRIMEVVKLKA